jgi:hypothetical protein
MDRTEGLERKPRRFWSGFRGDRAAQKISTASSTAVPMIDRCSGEPNSNSSSRLTIEPASSSTAGVLVALSTCS